MELFKPPVILNRFLGGEGGLLLLEAFSLLVNHFEDDLLRIFSTKYLLYI